MTKIKNVQDSTAIKVLRDELSRIQLELGSYVTEEGIVKTSCRYRYVQLVRRAAEYKQALDFLIGMYRGKASDLAGVRDDSMDSVGVVS